MLTHAIEQARASDPSRGSYATIQARTSSGGRAYRVGGRVRYRVYGEDDGETYDTQRFTTDSRREWQWRSDTTLGFLNDALAAARSLKKLDPQAVELGLDRLYPDGELELLITELQTAADRVTAERNRVGR